MNQEEKGEGKKYSKIQTSFMNSPFSENFVSIKELFALHALISLVTFSHKVASFDLFRFSTSLSENSGIRRRRAKAKYVKKIHTSFMNSPFSENFMSIKELFALHALITLVTFSYKVASFDLFWIY